MDFDPVHASAADGGPDTPGLSDGTLESLGDAELEGDPLSAGIGEGVGSDADASGLCDADGPGDAGAGDPVGGEPPQAARPMASASTKAS
jgi:hypothetical protein